ncbi:MAG TPA: ABC transporter ATP-binding protein [Bacteroidota bacterium]|nr:ABC transporter ATP-binding protein [Bacteroidota bacterium]
MDNVIEIESLAKSYPGFRLNDVSFTIPRGYITGLVGPNGAGKTTIIKLIMNLVRKEKGKIRVFGLDNEEHDLEIKDRIGFVYDTPYFYEDQELHTLMKSIGPYYSTWDEKKFMALLDQFGLSPHKKFITLSKGMKTKFALALALSHDADLIILDEPTAGLDPLFRREFLGMLTGIIQDENKSILFSTHITSDLDRAADYTVIIDNGQILCSLWKDEIQEKWGVVKGREEFVSGDNRIFFRGWRKHEYGFEALTSDAPRVRQLLGDRVVIERPTLEDMIFYMHNGGAHA